VLNKKNYPAELDKIRNLQKYVNISLLTRHHSFNIALNLPIVHQIKILHKHLDQ